MAATVAHFPRPSPPPSRPPSRLPRRSFSTLAERTEARETALSVNAYMRKIYLNSMLSFGGTLFAAEVLSSSALFLSGGSFFLGVGASLAGVIGFSLHRPERQRATDAAGRELLVAVDSATRKLWYGLFLGGGALTLAPLFAMANALSTTLVPYSIVLTAASFLGMSAYAMSRPLGSFNAWGSALSGALVSLLALQLLAGGSYLLAGPNAGSQLAFSVQPYLGLGLFSALQIYDTQAALQEYEQGSIDVLGHSMNFVLNLKNIFTSLLQILMRLRGGD